MTKFLSNRPVKSTLTASQSLVKPALTVRLKINLGHNYDGVKMNLGKFRDSLKIFKNSSP